jgi:hypothetical protein
VPERLALVLSCCLLSSGLLAQEYSYDGNRWYDVEVSIFTNEFPPGPFAEIAIADKLTPVYLSRLRELLPRSSSFVVDFGEMQQPLSAGSGLPAAIEPLPEPLPVLPGPVYSPAVPRAFRITDFSRDPYVDLDARVAQFTAMNRNIDAAREHRMLWHKLWRQPMQGRAQTQALFISGGEVRGRHTELEGSLRLSDNGGNVMLDLNIWLNRFTAGAADSAMEWEIPELPFPLLETAAGQSLAQSPAPAMEWVLAEVWQLEQTRELGANQLYYLDHPAVGMLIQIRPYLLPPRLVAEDEEDF